MSADEQAIIRTFRARERERMRRRRTRIINQSSSEPDLSPKDSSPQSSAFSPAPSPSQSFVPVRQVPSIIEGADSLQKREISKSTKCFRQADGTEAATDASQLFSRSDSSIGYNISIHYEHSGIERSDSLDLNILFPEMQSSRCEENDEILDLNDQSFLQYESHQQDYTSLSSSSTTMSSSSLTSIATLSTSLPDVSSGISIDQAIGCEHRECIDSLPYSPILSTPRSLPKDEEFLQLKSQLQSVFSTLTSRRRLPPEELRNWILELLDSQSLRRELEDR